MTLSTDVMSWIRHYFGKAVYPPPKSVSNHTGLWPKWLPTVRLVIIDVMVSLRKISYQFSEESSAEEKMRCIDFAAQVAEIAVEIMRNNQEQIKRVVLRFDRPGKTTIAKGAIYEDRYSKVEDYVLPDDGQNPFYDEGPMPASINSIFKNPKARELLYIYLTQYFLHVFENIPKGQELIIDGGMTTVGCKGTPFRLYHNEFGKLETKEMSEDYYLEQGEADLGCPFWSWKLNEDCIVASEDGDAIIIGLLQSLKRVKEDGTLTGPRMLIRKRQVVGRIPYEGEELEKRLIEKQNNKFIRLDRLVQSSHYIDIDQLRELIINDSSWYGGNKSDCPYPVELFCVLAFMPGNDFFKSFPMVQFNTLWKVFTANPKKYGKMVIVDVDNPKSQCVASPIRPLCYKIIRTIYLTFVWDCLKVAFPRCKDAQTLTDMLKDIPQFYTKYAPDPDTGESPKVTIPSLGRLNSSAANLAWCLAYFGNGSIPDSKHTLDYPLAEDEDGNPKFGWELKDASKRATISNVKFSDRVPAKTSYIAM